MGKDGAMGPGQSYKRHRYLNEIAFAYREWESRQPLLLNDTPRQITRAREALAAFDVMFK
jgi:hypothetical protein